MKIVKTIEIKYGEAKSIPFGNFEFTCSLGPLIEEKIKTTKVCERKSTLDEEQER